MMAVLESPSSIYRFDAWSRAVRRVGRLPKIVVVGTVGKTTVARLVDEIARSAGLRTALRVDGVTEILGRRRGGWPSAWSHAIDQLRAGTLDLAIEEVHWSDVPSIAAAPTDVAVLVVSTICPDRDVCRLDDTRAAISSLRALLSALPPDVDAVIDADDTASTLLPELEHRSVAVGAIRSEQPAFRRHVDAGRLGAWLEEGTLIVGGSGERRDLGPVERFPLTLDGTSLFEVHNIMSAALACVRVGLSFDVIASTVEDFSPTHARLPRSLNLFRTARTRVIVDRPSPSWLLAPLLRTLRAIRPGRLTCVVDYPSSHPAEDLVDVGRMLARQSHAFVTIDSEMGQAGVASLRAGIAQTPHPPPIIHTTSLPRAVRRAVTGSGENDITLILSPRPDAVHRVLARDRIADVA